MKKISFGVWFVSRKDRRSKSEKEYVTRYIQGCSLPGSKDDLCLNEQFGKLLKENY